MGRIDKENYYLDIADTVSERSTCLRRCYGAIIVQNDEIIATGYNGAPRGRKNCADLGRCTREELKIPSGQRYELCRSVHAEANCIISASRQRNAGGHPVHGLPGPQNRRTDSRFHLLLHVPQTDHQRRHRAGRHPGYQDRLPCGGRAKRVGGRGRLPS